MNLDPMDSPDKTIIKLIQWAEQHESIRAMLLTSTRAVPNAPLDDLSDYDVVLVVEDIHPFHEQQGWLGHFGEVLIVYRDLIHPDPDFGTEKFGSVNQYADGLKIDFTLLPVKWLQQIVQASALPAELDAGYQILLDKDHLTDDMPAPAYRAYLPTPPSNELYQRTINDFFSDAPYAAKCLLRNELFPLKWCLDYDMKHIYLRQILEWKVGVDHHWSVTVGALGKGLRKRLPAELWAQLQETYVGASVEANWEALFQTIALFRQVALKVGEALGYPYPEELDRRVTAYLQERRQRS